MGAVFDEVTNTNAPQVLDTEACIVILRVAQDSLDEIAVFDPANDFELVRSFGNPKEGFASSRLGSRYDGTILKKLKSWHRDRNPNNFLPIQW